MITNGKEISMKIFEEPKIEVVVLQVEDVIATSVDENRTAWSWFKKDEA